MRPCSMQWSARLEKKLFRCWTDICLEWSQLYRQRCSLRGLYISGNDLDRIETILHNYPKKDIKVIVLTDGENINGFGDLGVNAMGSSVGKLALGTACAQIHPEQVLPVNDSTDSILNDPAYIGIRQKRDRSVNYDRLIERFILAAQKTYGRSVLFIFHGLEKNNAFCMLERYRNTTTSFNDDIQGTASVVLAGLLASNQLTGKNKLSEHRFLFLGAGEADTGIADLIASSIVQQSPELTLKEAKERSFFVDSKGMVCSERKNLEHHKLPFAHDLKTLLGYNGPGFVYSILFCSSVFSFFFYSSLSLLHSSPFPRSPKQWMWSSPQRSSE
jgi:malate dehydrogenase (oxaloacetate-decarboxylating)(NADP+)